MTLVSALVVASWGTAWAQVNFDEIPAGFVIPPAVDTPLLSEEQVVERLPQRHEELRARHERYLARRLSEGLPAPEQIDIDEFMEALPAEVFVEEELP
jgi:hypothetical protein